MKCTQATQLLSEKMDRSLTTTESVSLKFHTAMCPACRRFGEQMGQLREISQVFVQQTDSARDENVNNQDEKK